MRVFSSEGVLKECFWSLYRVSNAKRLVPYAVSHGSTKRSALSRPGVPTPYDAYARFSELSAPHLCPQIWSPFVTSLA